MAAVDFALLQLEESPLNQNTFALGATPNRVATEKLFLALQALSLKPVPSFLDRADEVRSITGAVPKLLDRFAPTGKLQHRSYLDDLSWLLFLAGFTPVKTAGGPLVTDMNQTTVTGVNALNSAVVNVGDTSQFPAAGTFIFSGNAVTYTGKTATSFTGCNNHPATVGGETVNGNVPVGCNKWQWTKRTGFTAQTAQIILNYSDEAIRLQGNGYAISQMAFTSADGDLQCDLMGLYLQRLAVDGATVPVYTTQAVPPPRKGDLFLSWLPGGGPLSDFAFTIVNSLNPDSSMSLVPPSNFPDLMEYGDAQVQMTGTIPKRVLAAADIDALLAASTFAAKARWVLPKQIGITGYPYSMWIEMPAAQIVDGDFDPIDNKRRHGGSYSFEAAYDEASGFDVRITIINNTTAVGASIGLAA